MRETLQLHTSSAERGQAIQAIVRKITCDDPWGRERDPRPLVDLREGEVECYRNQEVSAAQAKTSMIVTVVSLTFATVVLAG